MSAYETITDIPGVTVELHPEEYAENPRTAWEHNTVIACRDDHRHYTFGDEDEQFDIERIVEEYAEERDGDDSLPELTAVQAVKRALIRRGAIEATMVGLAVTDHSGLYLHVGVPDGSNCGDQWDTSFVGWAYVTAEGAKAMGHEGVDVETGLTGAGYNLRDAAVAAAEEYGAYLSGDVHRYVVLDAATGEELDWCGGYLGYEWAKQAAREAGQHEAKRRAAELAELIYRAQVDLQAAFELARYEAAAAAFEAAA